MSASSSRLVRGAVVVLSAAALSGLYACSSATRNGTGPTPVGSGPVRDASTREFGRTPEQAEPAAPTLQSRLSQAHHSVEEFFGRSFPRPYEVHILKDRAEFSRYAKERWGMPETQCWMVAAGTATVMVAIDPAAWKTEACEHNPDDSRHVQQLFTHELVHVFHGQHSPRPEFDGMDDVGWFVEGLAVYASGQFDDARRREAREAIAKGAAPARLEDGWSGRYRYAVSGSLAAFVDERLGRAKLVELLAATQEAEILAALGMSETELLDAWRAWALARES